MPGIVGFLIIVPFVGYLVFAEFVARRDERRFRTDILDDDVQAQVPVASKSVVDASGWTGWRDVVVDSIQDESVDCRSFTFRSIDGSDFPAFKGGQSILIRYPSSDDPDAKPIARCYSLSSGPGESRYRITVKRVPGGRMSNRLHDRVNVGDVVSIQSPRGHFHIDLDHPERPIHLIAAGIGITPMLSMLLHSLEVTPDREVHLHYQLRDQRNAPFLKPLRYLHQTLSKVGTFHLHVWFSRPLADEPLQVDSTTGRITAPDIISHAGSTPSNADYRICGPNAFMESMATELIAGGARDKSVQYESFGGKAKGPGVIAVKTTVNEANVDEVPVRFTLSNQDAVWSSQNQSLLDIAEASGISVDSSCRSGQCGSCIHRLTRGTVRYPQPPTCEVAPGEVILCTARPDSDVEIEA
ncbi:Flavohemoprotein [Rubripirellula tenax]|uniref:Flavohemoprotein n=1 Tax=Rubripirellula tenax TaxID=2528015 RepID=A0A5C6FDK5_9BACT|nr:FAD-binding oxidoreductase [Rubripirellula tenax]TWU58670.1 Flavohemoprotein [Rubripirellula tenax]